MHLSLFCCSLLCLQLGFMLTGLVYLSLLVTCFSHWLGLAATIFVAVMVPVYIVLKRKDPKKNSFVFFVDFGPFCPEYEQVVGFSFKIGGRPCFVFGSEHNCCNWDACKIWSQNEVCAYVKFVHSYAVVFFYFVMVFHVLQFLLII